MKVLWLCNICAPSLANSAGEKETVYGGWIQSALDVVTRNNDIEISYLYPSHKLVDGTHEGINFYSFLHNDTNNINRFKTIIERNMPDIIHIWGTEFKHSLDMVKACEELGVINKVVVNIQGLIYKYAEVFDKGIPHAISKRKTLRDLLKNDCIKKQKQAFAKRGENEKEILRRVKNVVGRTEWDKYNTSAINPNLNYFYCSEVLRPVFYENKWDVDNCERCSIFVSQASYPIKGFHLLLAAIKILKSKYPMIKVYVGGENILNKSLIKRQRGSYYSKYIFDLVKKLGLEENIIMLGKLNADEMKKAYLSSNVFVSPSVAENSSNSVCEAMMLGVPVVSSYVGGIPSLIENNKTGLLYEVDNADALANCLIRLFDNDVLCKTISYNANIEAKKRHDKDVIYTDMISIYETIKKLG